MHVKSIVRKPDEVDRVRVKKSVTFKEPAGRKKRISKRILPVEEPEPEESPPEKEEGELTPEESCSQAAEEEVEEPMTPGEEATDGYQPETQAWPSDEEEFGQAHEELVDFLVQRQWSEGDMKAQPY